MRKRPVGKIIIRKCERVKDSERAVENLRRLIWII